MLPINIDIKKYLAKASEIGMEQKKENIERQTACSQQSIANSLVSSSLPSNPSAGPITQNPAQK